MCFCHVAMHCTGEGECLYFYNAPPPQASHLLVLLQWPVMDHPLSVSFIYQFSSGHASVKDVSGYFYFYCIVPSFSMGFLINIFIVLTPLCAFCVYYLLIYVYTYSVYSVYTIIMCIQRDYTKLRGASSHT